MKYLYWAADLLKAYLMKNALKVVLLIKSPQISNLSSMPSLQHLSYELEGKLFEISQDKLKKYFIEFISNMLYYMKEGDNKFVYFKDALTAFLGIFKSDISQGKWIAEIVAYFSYQILSLAHIADKQNIEAKDKPYDITARLLRDFFAACQTLHEDPSNSRVVSALPIINTLLKIYFRKNILRQSIGLTRWVDEGMVPLENFRTQDIVTYQFYAGRLAMMEGNFLKSQALLSQAFNRIGIKYKVNKRKALRNLIPVKIYLGQYPTKELLQKYELKQYYAIADAIRWGNLKVFDEEIEHHQSFFIDQGLYVMMEKLRSIALRNLIRLAIKFGSEKVQVPLEQIFFAIREASIPEEQDIELDEAQSLLANLMFKGWIKGYLSHEKRKVVLSKLNPFPALREVVKNNPDYHN